MAGEDEKYAAFLRLAAMLNKSFGVTPLLYGSLGLNRRLGLKLGADDIDILVPGRLLREDWDALLRTMGAEGYVLFDGREHEFAKDGLKAAFAEMDSLPAFAGVDPAGIPVVSDGGAEYLLLTLSDYHRVYTASSKDGYRAQVRGKKDTEKLRVIREVLWSMGARFLPVEDMTDGEIILRLKETRPANPAEEFVPSYVFVICFSDGTVLGRCDLRIGHNKSTACAGNIGYTVYEAYRGRHYAAKACALLFDLARRHGMDYLYITCDPENAASAKTCEIAGGEFMWEIDVPEDTDMYRRGRRRVKVYWFDLKGRRR